MKKIPTLFQRDFSTQPPKLLREVTPGCEWVLAGEGRATAKYDGSACLIDDHGTYWRRYDAKRGKKPPSGFWPAINEPDPETAHWPGWVPVGEGEADRWHREALSDHVRLFGQLPDLGTYELIGSKVNANPYGLPDGVHRLVKHGSVLVSGAPRDWDGLRTYLDQCEHEGIVFHHEDGRMAKIRRKDYGFRWPHALRKCLLEEEK